MKAFLWFFRISVGCILLVILLKASFWVFAAASVLLVLSAFEVNIEKEIQRRAHINAVRSLMGAETAIHIPHNPDIPITVETIHEREPLDIDLVEVSGELVLREILHSAITRRLTNLNNRQTQKSFVTGKESA